VGEHYITLKKLGYKRGLRVAQVKESGGSPVVGKLTRSDKYLLVEQAVVKVAGQMGQSPIDSVVDNLRETLFLDQTVFVKLRKLTGGRKRYVNGPAGKKVLVFDIPHSSEEAAQARKRATRAVDRTGADLFAFKEAA
jgi:hypothetical protein